MPARHKAERLGTVVAFTALLGASASLSFRPLMSAARGGARLAVTEAGAAGAPNSADAPSAANSTDGPFAANSTDGPFAANSTDAPFAPAHNGTDYASESRPTIQVYLIESDSWPSAAGGSIDTWKFLEYLVWPLQTNQTNYSFSTRTYSDLGTLLDAAEADSAVLSAGSVVIYPVHAHISTRNYTGGAKGSVLNHSVDASRSIDPYCAYQFSDVDPLLLAPPVQRLLAWPKPLVLVDASDWACRTTYPPTIHQVWRNAYGGGALMEHARFVPFGVSLLRDASNWKHNATRARATPISARPWALAAINSLSQRKTERVHVHRLMSGGMEAELLNISLRRGTAGIVVDYERQGENETSYDFESTDGG